MKLKDKQLLTDPQCEDAVLQLKLIPVQGETLRSFRHGQCVRIGIAGSRKPSPAYFAIASAPEDDEGYDFVVKQSGGIANYLCQMEEGMDIELDGPMGKGFDLPSMQGKNIILVGVGTGIAPLRSLWRSIVRNRNDFGKVSIHAGFLTSLHRLLADEMGDLDRHAIDVHTTLTHHDEGWSGPIGYVQHSLQDLAPSAENTVVCLAGMNAMVEGCTKVLLQLGFTEQQIQLNY